MNRRAIQFGQATDPRRDLSFVLIFGLIATVCADADCPNCQEFQFNGVDDEKALSQLQAFLSEQIGNGKVVSIDTKIAAKIDQATTESPANEETTTNEWSGWNKAGDMNFKCFNDEMATYSDAKSHCERYNGGRLAAAVLRHPEVASYIASNCVSIDSDQRHPWIGFEDIDEENVWVWSDGGVMNDDTTKWDDGEPNNSGGLEGENCAQIWDVSNGRLEINDSRCSQKFHFICEV